MKKKMILLAILGLVVLLIVISCILAGKKVSFPPMEIKELGVPVKITKPVTATFREGEELTWEFKYLGFITVGEAIFKVKEVKYQGLDVYYLVSEGRSSAFFSLFRELHCVLESYMDARRLHSLRFEEHTRVGDCRDERVTVYDQRKKIARVMETTGDESENFEVSIGEQVQDFLSALYYLRTRDFQEGACFRINLNDRKKNFELEARVLEKEVLKSSCDNRQFTVYPVQVKARRVRKKNSQPVEFTVWFSDDEQKLPLLIANKTRIGPVKAHLVSAK